jgi:hypothetical protein
MSVVSRASKHAQLENEPELPESIDLIFNYMKTEKFESGEEIFFLKISRRANFSVDKASGRSFSRFFSISDGRDPQIA